MCKLDNIRCDAIRLQLDGVRDLIDRLLVGPAGCKDTCSALNLGNLLRQLKAHDLLSIIYLNPAQPPFTGLRQAWLADKAEKIFLIQHFGSLGCVPVGSVLLTIRQKARLCLDLKPSDFGFETFWSWNMSPNREREVVRSQ